MLPRSEQVLPSLLTIPINIPLLITWSSWESWSSHCNTQWFWRGVITMAFLRFALFFSQLGYFPKIPGDLSLFTEMEAARGNTYPLDSSLAKLKGSNRLLVKTTCSSPPYTQPASPHGWISHKRRHLRSWMHLRFICCGDIIWLYGNYTVNSLYSRQFY